MAKITSLVTQLRTKYSNTHPDSALTFVEDTLFSWNPKTHELHYNPSGQDAPAYLLHEYGHVLDGETAYSQDIELLQIERSAWDRAVETGRELGVTIDENLIEDSLDTYRDWLHARSLCPRCEATGIQTTRFGYQCLACQHTWRVNEARQCALRRYSQ